MPPPPPPTASTHMHTAQQASPKASPMRPYKVAVPLPGTSAVKARATSCLREESDSVLGGGGGGGDEKQIKSIKTLYMFLLHFFFCERQAPDGTRREPNFPSKSF